MTDLPVDGALLDDAMAVTHTREVLTRLARP